MRKMSAQVPKHYVFGNHFYSTNTRKLRFHAFLHFNARKHMISSFYLKWTEFTRDYEFVPFSLGPQGLTIGTKFTISIEFSLRQVKWWYHMFSSMEKEEYMESELSDFFWVKVVTETIVFGSLRTQRKTPFAVWCLLLKKHTNCLSKLLHLSVFLGKQYTSLIYVKKCHFV